jgi:hypothetical protein
MAQALARRAQTSEILRKLLSKLTRNMRGTPAEDHRRLSILGSQVSESKVKSCPENTLKRPVTDFVRTWQSGCELPGL